MDRYTKKDAEAAFDRLCAATGHSRAEAYNDHGAWSLDYVACYGGFVVEEIDDVSCGVSHPMGERRRSAREFVQAVRFAIDAISERDKMVSHG